jgi:hypothetical protein
MRSEIQTLTSINNQLEGKLAECEERFEQSLILLTKMINKPSESLKEAVIEFIDNNTPKAPAYYTLSDLTGEDYLQF